MRGPRNLRNENLGVLYTCPKNRNENWGVLYTCPKNNITTYRNSFRRPHLQSSGGYKTRPYRPYSAPDIGIDKPCRGRFYTCPKNRNENLGVLYTCPKNELITFRDSSHCPHLQFTGGYKTRPYRLNDTRLCVCVSEEWNTITQKTKRGQASLLTPHTIKN